MYAYVMNTILPLVNLTHYPIQLLNHLPNLFSGFGIFNRYIILPNINNLGTILGWENLVRVKCCSTTGVWGGVSTAHSRTHGTAARQLTAARRPRADATPTAAALTQWIDCWWLIAATTTATHAQQPLHISMYALYCDLNFNYSCWHSYNSNFKPVEISRVTI